MYRKIKIERIIPYTVVFGGCSGAILDGYVLKDHGRFPFPGTMLGLFVGVSWPVLIPLGGTVGIGVAIRKFIDSKD